MLQFVPTGAFASRPLMPRAAARLLAGAAVLALSACGGDDTGPPPTESQIEVITRDEVFTCPDVSVVADVSEIRRYAGAVRDPSQLVAELSVGNFTGGCSYDEGSVRVILQVDFDAVRGPRYTGEPVAFEYFVAIVDQSERILAKEVFATAVEIESDAAVGRVTEELVQTIPLERRALGPTYQVLLGFQVSEAELRALRAE
ncbi:MAG: hypothetical protein H6843_13190 [Rhodospirillaceae bacterium]|nr:hypothetical protein [Rhodospirillaceae bacterium]